MEVAVDDWLITVFLIVFTLTFCGLDTFEEKLQVIVTLLVVAFGSDLATVVFSIENPFGVELLTILFSRVLFVERAAAKLVLLLTFTEGALFVTRFAGNGALVLIVVIP